MLETKKKYNQKLKPYHIILLAVALCPFLILNSNSVNKKREEEAQLNEDHKFLEKLYLRKLDFKSDVDAICEKGSDDLKEYYKKGDPKLLEIDDEEIKSEDNPEYINSLINLVAGEGSTEENATEYGKHLLPVIVFLALSFLSLPIWFIYCICCCSNCCCCCCCKKEMCKIPFFIVTAAFYALILGISVYGLSQSNSIFVGLADTECSLLKFIGEVLDGETKETKPKWAGISGIKGLFQNTLDQIGILNPADRTPLLQARTDASDAKNDFENALQYYSRNLDPTTNTNYNKEINEEHYCLDIIVNFGKFTKGDSSNPPTAEPSSSLVSGWYEEFKIVSSNSEEQMQTAYNNYDQLITGKTTAEDALTGGINEIGNIEGSFNDIKDQISGAIISYSDKIDEYGKLAFKIIFSVFMVLDIAIAAFITLLLFCSFKFCKSCCCFRCLFKSLLHILWNILAFLTFLVLLLGSIFTLVGTVGKDLISVVSYLVSDKNLNKDKPLLVEQVKDYLSKCINGNGDIGTDLFGSNLNQMDNINSLRSASNTIDSLITQLENVKTNTIAYNHYEGEFNKRINYDIDNFQLINLDGGDNLNFKTYLDSLNSNTANSKNHEWSISCSGSASHSCGSHTESSEVHLCINPKTCNVNNILDWYSGSSDNNLVVLNAFINSIQTAKSPSPDETASIEVDGTTVIPTNNIYTILGDLKTYYNSFIDAYKTSLEGFSEKINAFAAILNEFAGEGNNDGIYSIINCKFIGRNVKIILKNLEESLGQSFYTVGICLVISGISMLLSIAFTILLNSIISENSGK